MHEGVSVKNHFIIISSNPATCFYGQDPATCFYGQEDDVRILVCQQKRSTPKGSKQKFVKHVDVMRYHPEGARNSFVKHVDFKQEDLTKAGGSAGYVASESKGEGEITYWHT